MDTFKRYAFPSKYMRDRCKYSDCKCRHYEDSVCRCCNHGAIWHRMKKVDNDKDLCTICYEKNKNCLILPCKHFLMCSDCCENLDKCPYCCENIETKIKGIYT